MTLDSFCNPFNIWYIPKSLLSDILLEGIVTGWWVECVIQCRISILMEEVPILFQELRLSIKGRYIILTWTAPPSPSSPQKCDDRGKFLQRRGKKRLRLLGWTAAAKFCTLCLVDQSCFSLSHCQLQPIKKWICVWSANCQDLYRMRGEAARISFQASINKLLAYWQGHLLSC